MGSWRDPAILLFLAPAVFRARFGLDRLSFGFDGYESDFSSKYEAHGWQTSCFLGVVKLRPGVLSQLSLSMIPVSKACRTRGHVESRHLSLIVF